MQNTRRNLRSLNDRARRRSNASSNSSPDSPRRFWPMALLTEIDPKDATGQTKALFDRLERAVGRVPTMIRLMGASPAVLDAYLHFNHALEQTTLSPKTRALITVAIAELNGCDYTLSLGMALGKRQGVPEDELDAARSGRANDAKTRNTLEFATNVVRRAGRVPRANVERLLHNGFSSQEIVDIIAAVALNVFRNYFNLALATDIDSPIVRTKQSAHLV
jgi:AhpD family alkylhydroperoxidase